MKKYASLGLAVALSVLLSGCGFRLRGYQLPVWLHDFVIIQVESDPYLIAQLTSQLIYQGVNQAPSLKTARYQLIIKKALFGRRMVAVAASTTPRQFELTYTVLYELIGVTPQKSTVFLDSKVVVSRLLTVNNDRILGSNFEEASIKKEMQREAVTQLINQISMRQRPPTQLPFAVAFPKRSTHDH